MIFSAACRLSAPGPVNEISKSNQMIVGDFDPEDMFLDDNSTS